MFTNSFTTNNIELYFYLFFMTFDSYPWVKSYRIISD